MKFFLTVAQEKSFTAAARVLGVTQPAVSQNIADLERSLGVKLFDRLRSEVALTAEGNAFMPYARSIMDMSLSAEELFMRLPASVVRVSASEEVYEYILAPAIRLFSQIHPETVFERSVFDEGELTLVLRPQAGSPFDEDDSVISKIRVSMFLPEKKTGDLSATCEKTSYMELLFKPAPTFSSTKTCRVFRQFLKDNLI